MLKPSIRVRGISLVVFPLVCQLVFVSVLFVLLIQLQTELIRESRTRELAGCSHEVMRGIIEIVTYAYLGHERNQLMDIQTTTQKFDRLMPRLERVIELSKLTGTADNKEIAAYRTATNDMVDLFKWAVKEQSKGLKHWRLVKHPLDHAMMQRTQTFLNAMTNVVEKGDDKSMGPDPAVLALQEKLKVVLIVAFVASILLAVALASIFVAGISGPLVRLTANGRRLSKGEELLPVLKGNDEFSKLDQLFHAASTAISEAVTTEQAMITNAADMICSLDAGAVFIKVNPYATTMFACDSDEQLIGKCLYDLVLEEDLVKAETEITEVVMSQRTRVFELRMRKMDGTAIDTSWSAFWSDTEGYLFCVVHDVTEERNIERLKQDFLDMISHDLRSPLTAMLASMSMMSAGARGPLSEPAMKTVKQSVKDIEELIDFVNDLLDYQKLQAGRMPVVIQNTSFGALLSETVGNVKSMAEEKKIEIKVPSGDWPVNCDKPKIGQALINLLTYAIDESLENQSILLEVDETNDGMVCKVKYTGDRKRQWDEDFFEQISETPVYSGGRPGIGVRLALGKLIVEAHGGKIGAKHDEFTGERFARKVKIEFDNTLWFSLPAKPPVLGITASLTPLR